jgi:hypothetical protein
VIHRPDRLVVLAGLLVLTTCVVALHGLRSDLSPVSNRVSEYANGPYGWLMAVAFSALGVGLVALGRTLRHAPHRPWAPVLLYAAGIGAVVSGVYRTGAPPPSETVHSLASTSMTVAIVMVAVAGALPWGRREILGPTLAWTAAILVVLSTLLHDTRWTGLAQRTLWAVLLVWLWRLASAPEGGGRISAAAATGTPTRQ